MSEESTVAELTPTEANACLDRFHLVDVREPHEFEGPLGFIEGAELVPLAKIEDAAPALVRSGPLLLICRSGKRSGAACETLRKRGAEEAVNLTGGMIAWNRAGLPVVRTEPKSLEALVEQIVRWWLQVGSITEAAARAEARERCALRDEQDDAAACAAVETLIGFVGETLAGSAPPDLELSLRSFRRTLSNLSTPTLTTP